MTQNIDSCQISVVVQGPIYPNTTPACLKSLRKILPLCEIILSTWEGSDVNGLDYDILVLNKDPGSTRMFVHDNANKYNLNRQIVSTQGGLGKVTKKYTLKFRTDFILRSSKFLEYIDAFTDRSDNWKITAKRIVMPMGTQPYCKVFHPTDVISFGLTSDIKNLWSCKLPSTELSDWFLNHRLPFFADNKVCMKIGAEMYIWSELLKKYQSQFGNIKVKHNWDDTKTNIELSKLTLANNTIMLDRDQFEFETPEHTYLFNPDYSWTWIDHNLWKIYYYKFCSPYNPMHSKVYAEYDRICRKQRKKMFSRKLSTLKKRIKSLIKF